MRLARHTRFAPQRRTPPLQTINKKLGDAPRGLAVAGVSRGRELSSSPISFITQESKAGACCVRASQSAQIIYGCSRIIKHPGWSASPTNLIFEGTVPRQQSTHSPACSQPTFRRLARRAAARLTGLRARLRLNTKSGSCLRARTGARAACTTCAVRACGDVYGSAEDPLADGDLRACKRRAIPDGEGIQRESKIEALLPLRLHHGCLSLEVVQEHGRGMLAAVPPHIQRHTGSVRTHRPSSPMTQVHFAERGCPDGCWSTAVTVSACRSLALGSDSDIGRAISLHTHTAVRRVWPHVSRWVEHADTNPAVRTRDNAFSPQSCAMDSFDKPCGHERGGD